MNDFAMEAGVVVGQYLPGDSWLHRLDPRIKLLGGLGWLTAAVISDTLLGLSIGWLAMALAAWTAQLPWRTIWQGMRRSLPFLALLAALQLFIHPGEAVVWHWWRLSVTVAGLEQAALLLLRFTLLIGVISELSLTTRTNDLVHGMAYLMGPLQRIGVPTHELSLMFDITLRFVPMLAIEMERLAKAQASRGGDWDARHGGLAARVRRVVPLIVPLFLAALQRAERLATAMEARGYVGGRGRTSMIRFETRGSDWAAMAAQVGLWILVVWA